MAAHPASPLCRCATFRVFNQRPQRSTAQAGHHQAVALPVDTSGSWPPRSLLFEWRCALEVCATAITPLAWLTFRSSQSVRAARLRPAQALAAHQCTPRFASCWNSRRLRRGLALDPPAVLHSRYGHALRFYIRPHCPQCAPVAALKLRLVSPTAARPAGESNRPYAKCPSLQRGRVSRRRFPVATRPTRHRPGALGRALCSGYSARRCAHFSSQWPAANHHGEPPPTHAHACAAQPRRRGPSAPHRGSRLKSAPFQPGVSQPG